MPTEQRHDAPTIQTFYANNIAIEASSFDVKLKLGLVQTATPDEITVEDVAQVYLSPDHFKAFVKVLNSIAEQMDAPQLMMPGPRAFLGQ